MSAPLDGGIRRGWLSAYLFFDGWMYEAECDRLVREVVRPFAERAAGEGWTDGHFFIRYSEHGPHLRLRLHGDEAVLEERVWPALVEQVRAHSPAVSVGTLPDTPVFRRPEGADAVPVTHLVRAAYDPETERYGGPDALLVAERHFRDSSEATFGLMERMGDARSSRLGKGLLAMVVLVHVFARDRAHAAAFAQAYSTNYLRSVAREDGGREAFLGAFDQGYEQQADTLGAYVEEVWTRLDEGEPLSEILDAWTAALRATRAELRALQEAGRVLVGGAAAGWEAVVAAIVPSYVHMTNNRLGITIQEESYLGYLIHRALGAAVESGAA